MTFKAYSVIVLTWKLLVYHKYEYHYPLFFLLLQGDVQPLVAELLTAAASLPPPPSDMDLETAEIPGPESDRPSDIIMSRPRFTSIPTSNWSSSVTSISRISSGGILNELSTTTENLSTLKIKSDFSEDQTVASDVEHNETEGHLLSVTSSILWVKFIVL